MSDDSQVPRRLSRAEAKARTREQLLESASRIFIRSGFAGASVEEIAETAGYSIGALYSNFASKDQLFMELMASRRTNRIAALVKIVSENEERGEISLEDLPRLLLELAEKDSDFAALQVEFWQYASRHPELRDTRARLVREQADVLGALITDVLHREGVELNLPVGDVTTVVMAMVQGLTRRRRLEGSSVSDDLFVEALGWLFSGMRGASAAKKG